MNIHLHPLAITSLYNYRTLVQNHRKMSVGSSMYRMATQFWKTEVPIILISCICSTDGANILGIFPMPIKSHMTVHSALRKELARRGHQVTFFSPFPEKYSIQNFTDIEFKLSYSELLQNSGEYHLHLQFKFYIAQFHLNRETLLQWMVLKL